MTNTMFTGERDTNGQASHSLSVGDPVVGPFKNTWGVRARLFRGRWSSGHMVMVVTGLLGAVLSLAALRAGDHRTSIAVAARDLRPGEVITARSFRFTSIVLDDTIAASMIPSDAAAGLHGSIVATRIDRGAPVARHDLVRAAASQRRRSLGIAVAPERAVGGGIGAGDVIDVLSIDPDNPGIVVAGLRVLDVRRAQGALATTNDTMTVVVALDAADARRLAAVLGTDKFVLVLATGAAPISPDARALAPAIGQPRLGDGAAVP